MDARDEDTGIIFDVPAHMLGQKDRIGDAMTWLFYGSIVIGNLAIWGNILWMAIA